MVLASSKHSIDWPDRSVGLFGDQSVSQSVSQSVNNQSINQSVTQQREVMNGNSPPLVVVAIVLVREVSALLFVLFSISVIRLAMMMVQLVRNVSFVFPDSLSTGYCVVDKLVDLLGQFVVQASTTGWHYEWLSTGLVPFICLHCRQSLMYVYWVDLSVDSINNHKCHFVTCAKCILKTKSNLTVTEC